MEIRPSSLPKLAECPVFVSAGGTSTQAQRGTTLDVAIRQGMQGDLQSILAMAEEDDRVASLWAIPKLGELSQGHPVETREEFLGMHVPGLSSSGTADAVCIGAKWVADIKSGQIRNYQEQLAAYSLACMDTHWETTWTAHVLYIDQRVVRSYEFTREQAERIVQSVIGSATSPVAKPRPCEYCNWCANKESCSALVVQSKAALADVHAINGDTLTIIRDRILANPVQHSDFVSRFKWFSKEFGEPLTDMLKEKLIAGEDVPGWKLTNPSPRRYVEPGDAIALAAKLKPEQAFLAGGGKMSADTFVELANEVGIENPEQLVKSAPGISQMRQVKKKEK